MGFALAAVLPGWLNRRTVGGAAEQSSHWQAFRKAALSTPYYKRHPITPGTVTELAHFYGEHSEFLQPGAAPPLPPPAPLTGVWDPMPKAVAVKPWFRLQTPVETVLTAREVAGRSRCELVAAPVGVLVELAQTDAPRMPSPGFGIIAFTGISQQPLTPAIRDWLWAAWRVPIFEQFRGFQGELLAAECEAFEGLHFEPDAAPWEERGNGELLNTSLVNLRHPAWRLATGRWGRVEQSACPCGSPLPRVIWA